MRLGSSGATEPHPFYRLQHTLLAVALGAGGERFWTLKHRRWLRLKYSRCLFVRKV